MYWIIVNLEWDGKSIHTSKQCAHSAKNSKIRYKYGWTLQLMMGMWCIWLANKGNTYVRNGQNEGGNGNDGMERSGRIGRRLLGLRFSCVLLA